MTFEEFKIRLMTVPVDRLRDKLCKHMVEAYEGRGGGALERLGELFMDGLTGKPLNQMTKEEMVKEFWEYCEEVDDEDVIRVLNWVDEEKENG